jgi:hypothetical protein
MKATFLIYILFVFTTTICNAQTNYIPGNYSIRNYLSEEYNGHFQNWNVTQDNRGVMYFANNARVLEYDGKNWKSFLLNSESKVLSVQADRNGVIYVGGIGEIGYLGTNEVGQKEFISLVDKIPEDHISFKNIWRIVACLFQSRGRLLKQIFQSRIDTFNF